MKRCNQCIKFEILHTACQKCKELKEFEALMSGDATELPKIDLGQALMAEEMEVLWSEDLHKVYKGGFQALKRQEIVNQNGNDGLIYDMHGDIWEVE